MAEQPMKIQSNIREVQSAEYGGKRADGGEYKSKGADGGEYKSKGADGAEYSGKMTGGAEHNGKVADSTEYSGKITGGAEYNGKVADSTEYSGKGANSGEHNGKRADSAEHSVKRAYSAESGSVPRDPAGPTQTPTVQTLPAQTPPIPSQLPLLKQKLEKQMEAYATGDVCLAFSGGVDSSLLLKAAVAAADKRGTKVYAVTFDSRLHPSCDLEIAARVAAELGGIHHVISVNELEQEAIRNNPPDRCYLCKKHLFQTLKSFAAERGVSRILDGTNEDDMHVYRPGIRALKELGITSPLAQLHITKSQVKALAADYGISVASRPSTPCMATRIPYNTRIDYDILGRAGQGEAWLRSAVSGNVRLRLHGNIARIEVDGPAMEELLKKREEVAGRLKELGFDYITLDLEGFRSGSMDIGIDQV